MALALCLIILGGLPLFPMGCAADGTLTDDARNSVYQVKSGAETVGQVVPVPFVQQGAQLVAAVAGVILAVDQMRRKKKAQTQANEAAKKCEELQGQYQQLLQKVKPQLLSQSASVQSQ